MALANMVFGWIGIDSDRQSNVPSYFSLAWGNHINSHSCLVINCKNKGCYLWGNHINYWSFGSFLYPALKLLKIIYTNFKEIRCKLISDVYNTHVWRVSKRRFKFRIYLWSKWSVLVLSSSYKSSFEPLYDLLKLIVCTGFPW